ncbi:hypothetical protein ACFPTY_19950 [Halomonas beimenensis]|uniref:hypothetical protein n=1 Tax=Halomonas beimenensis TaxID=475662 RepID=UPI0036230625
MEERDGETIEVDDFKTVKETKTQELDQLSQLFDALGYSASQHSVKDKVRGHALLMKKHSPEAEALFIQKHQVTEGQRRLSEIKHGLSELQELRQQNHQIFDQLNAELDASWKRKRSCLIQIAVRLILV